MPNPHFSPNEPKMITVQLSPDFYQRFVSFCFKTEITRSDAIRMGLSILMDAEKFICDKGKSSQQGKPS
jgi:hypothetical protein